MTFLVSILMSLKVSIFNDIIGVNTVFNDIIVMSYLMLFFFVIFPIAVGYCQSKLCIS